MKSAIAILTYNRLPALQTMLMGIAQHCKGYPVAVFDDLSLRDGTRAFLTQGAKDGSLVERPDLMAQQAALAGDTQVFLGTENLGVAGNSNRALRWFMDSDCDHLLLCNDDLHVLGDFAAAYAQAHLDLGPGFFSFNDFWELPTHRWVIARSRGYAVKLYPRMTGIMMSVLRRAVDSAGYFDTRFGKFGEEHCDWTNRLRRAGEVQLDGFDQACLDVDFKPPVLRHQDVATSVQGEEREVANAEAARAIQEAAVRYATEHHYRPFSLVSPDRVGGLGRIGTKAGHAAGYLRV